MVIMEKGVSVFILCLCQSLEFIWRDGYATSFKNSSLLVLFQILEAGREGSV